MDGHHLSNITKLEKQSLCSDMVDLLILFYTNYIKFIGKIMSKNEIQILKYEKQLIGFSRFSISKSEEKKN
jgi:hypothetical protein